LDTTLNPVAVPLTPEFGDLIGADFDRIVILNQKRIFRILLLLLRDTEAADILTQECFLRAFQKRGSFRGESRVETWLVRIALNLARDHARNRRMAFWRRLVPCETLLGRQLATEGLSPEALLLAREAVSSIWSAAGKLPDRQKTVFLLRHAEEMSIEEIAEVTKLKAGTVKAHLSRATAAVRQQMEV